ncbi:hypothetical protein FC700_21050 [Bacillus mycoides]|nr:hypothetical protein [Bacillus mycoides]TKI39630.1 hypothetical protein FC700_21050 [Bacillus mycoides]
MYNIPHNIELLPFSTQITPTLSRYLRAVRLPPQNSAVKGRSRVAHKPPLIKVLLYFSLHNIIHLANHISNLL